MSWRSCASQAIVLITLLTACSGPAGAPRLVAASTIPPPTITSTSEISKQCIYTFTASAWIDENENGEWDTGEGALPGVTFDTGGARPSVTDEAGKAVLTVDWGGADCRQAMFEAGFVIRLVGMPPGYRLTTAPEQPVPPTQVQFGFAPLPTPTPLPYPDALDVVAVHDRVLGLINGFRRLEEVEPLEWDDILQDLADQRAWQIVQGEIPFDEVDGSLADELGEPVAELRACLAGDITTPPAVAFAAVEQ